MTERLTAEEAEPQKLNVLRGPAQLSHEWDENDEPCRVLLDRAEYERLREVEAAARGLADYYGWSYAEPEVMTVLRAALSKGAESCSHESRSGADDRALDERAKLWRCDACGSLVSHD